MAGWTCEGIGCWRVLGSLATALMIVAGSETARADLVVDPTLQSTFTRLTLRAQGVQVTTEVEGAHRNTISATTGRNTATAFGGSQGGQQPAAYIEISAGRSQGNGWDAASASAEALFWYQMRLLTNEGVEAPWSPQTVPVRVQGIVQASARAAGYDSVGVSASASLEIDYPVQLDITASTGAHVGSGVLSSSDENEFDELIQARPGAGLTVRLTASASGFAWAGSLHSSSISAWAYADPIFTLDQAAFDAMAAAAGQQTFVLADYYTIAFSPNIPEPGALALFACGSVLCSRRRGTRG